LITDLERQELEELRRYRLMHEGKALHRAFARLEQLLDTVNQDHVMHVRAFRVITECLICLKEELRK
jgi:hypothetical protein